MDRSITLITPARMRAAGAAAFDEGKSVDAHGMNASSSAAKDWQAGYLQREFECRRHAGRGAENVGRTARQLAQVSRP